MKTHRKAKGLLSSLEMHLSTYSRWLKVKLNGAWSRSRTISWQRLKITSRLHQIEDINDSNSSRRSIVTEKLGIVELARTAGDFLRSEIIGVPRRIIRLGFQSALSG
ncbi:hypothetical protein YC2023_113001 [Brassica napus]